MLIRSPHNQLLQAEQPSTPSSLGQNSIVHNKTGRLYALSSLLPTVTPVEWVTASMYKLMNRSADCPCYVGAPVYPVAGYNVADYTFTLSLNKQLAVDRLWWDLDNNYTYIPTANPQPYIVSTASGYCGTGYTCFRHVVDPFYGTGYKVYWEHGSGDVEGNPYDPSIRRFYFRFWYDGTGIHRFKLYRVLSSNYLTFYELDPGPPVTGGYDPEDYTCYVYACQGDSLTPYYSIMWPDKTEKDNFWNLPATAPCSLIGSTVAPAPTVGTTPFHINLDLSGFVPGYITGVFIGFESAPTQLADHAWQDKSFHKVTGSQLYSTFREIIFVPSDALEKT